MNANEPESIEILIEDVVGATHEVANTLGCEPLGEVYGRAPAKELIQRGRAVTRQVPIPRCINALVGEYLADLVVEEKLVVELRVR
jgi:GxxExxY protein